jgi:hypothetical protein
MSGEFSIEVSNQAGQMVMQRKVSLNNALKLEVLMEQSPPPGIYYLRARQAGSGKVYSGKLLFTR